VVCCFSLVEFLNIQLGKPASISVDSHYTVVFFNWEKKSTRAYLCVRVIFPLLFVYSHASSKSFAPVGAERQTNIHKYIYSYIHAHTLFVKQFLETRRVPGLITNSTLHSTSDEDEEEGTN